MLTLVARGSVSDFSNTSHLKQKIATAAEVDASAVTISIEAASVLVTALIAVSASTTAAAVQTSLVSNFNTIAAASTALGVVLESVPTVALASPLSPLPPPPSPQNILSPAAPPLATDASSITGLYLGIAVGVCLALVALVTAACVVRNRRKRKVPATSGLDGGGSSGPRMASAADGDHGQAVAAAAGVVAETAKMDAGPTKVEMATAAQATAAAAELVERGSREADLQAALEQAQQQLAEASVVAATATATAAATQLELDNSRSFSQASIARSSTGSQSMILYDCFLTHDWGEDEAGRNNHARVARVCAALKAEGLQPWFDEDQMRGDINHKMVEGIEASASMVCFITKRYLQKAWGVGPNGANDNCKFEFDYACRRKGVERMIPVVMEQGCRNSSEWTGTVGGKLGGLLYFDLSSDGVDFDKVVKRLADEIRLISAGGGGGVGGGMGGHPAPGPVS